ncbi:MAG: hypothetical protein ACERK6_12310 [Candidatus Aminicenantaceae bacterium]
MINSYLKIAFRNMKRYKVYSFINITGLAIGMAWPLDYVLMRQWLQNFAYRVSIQPWIFLSSAAAALFIALLTISFHVLKAALADPVDSLRYE